MGEIPEDIKFLAENLVLNHIGSIENSFGLKYAVEKAIYAERQRAAKIALWNAKDFNFQEALANGDDIEVGAKSVQLAISQAILADKEES